MFMKSNLSKMLGRLAPPQSDGRATTPSDMMAYLRQMAAMRPRRPTSIDRGMVSQPAIPQPYQEGIVAQPLPYNPINTTRLEDIRGRPGSGASMGSILNSLRNMQQPAPQPYQEEIVVAPPRPMGPLSMQQDPEFNINTATNTFFKSLGDRVASGQMTLDQARAAQAEMRALQLNPAMANRAAATEIAQRNLQVGPYAPRQGTPMAAPQGLGMAIQTPMMQPAPQGLTLSNVPQQGAAPQPMTAPQGMAMGGLMAKYYGGAC